MTPSRRIRVVAAVIWWVSILVLLPTGRPIVTTLRDRGLLAVAVTIGSAGVLAFVGLGGWRLYRRGGLTPAQVRIALFMATVVVGAAQLLPRFEERWHCVQYTILGALIWSALGERSRRLPVAVVLTAALGWLDEGVQLLLPDRVYDWWDVALNAAAGTAGVTIAELTERVGRRSRRLESP